MSHRKYFESLALSAHLCRLHEFLLQAVAAQTLEQHGLLAGGAGVQVLDVLQPLVLVSQPLACVRSLPLGDGHEHQPVVMESVGAIVVMVMAGLNAVAAV